MASERDLMIWQARRDGDTYARIGKDWDLSISQVKRIIKKVETEKQPAPPAPSVPPPVKRTKIDDVLKLCVKAADECGDISELKEFISRMKSAINYVEYRLDQHKVREHALSGKRL